jgi:hypothetical protein
MKYLHSIVVIIVLIAGSYYLATREPVAPVPISNERIRVTSPAPDRLITSPLTVAGEARGMWYFEASFPLAILDADRAEIAQSHAEAQGEWMTEDFVPFVGTVEFVAPTSDTGFVVFKKDNPSGLPEHDASVEIPVRFR